MSIFEKILAERFGKVAQENGGILGIFKSPNRLYTVYKYPSGNGQTTVTCYNSITGNNTFNKTHPTKVLKNIAAFPTNRAGLRV